MPYLTYALLQTKYGFQLFWETSAFFLSSFWAVITGPWTLVWMVIDTTKELTLNALQFVKFQIAKVLHLGLALWYKMKPHITKVISDLTVFIRASLNQLKSFSHKVLDELHRLVIHYKVYETMNQIRVQLLNWARQLIKDTRIIGNQILASMQNLLSQILLTISYTVTTIQAQISYILLQLQFELQRFRKAF
ncbi:hypothetical protein BC833DRAFT_574433 [Globomyces pollinis-pini]|nr:hypothetical protein BC833DRAFT_574433 [Globomyces pollinis-pini]